MFVPVVDQNQQPLMLTTPERARCWIRSGKATSFWKGGIFCVRLNVEPSARDAQPVAVGIDPSSKREGYSVVSAAHTYLNIQVMDIFSSKGLQATATLWPPLQNAYRFVHHAKEILANPKQEAG